MEGTAAYNAHGSWLISFLRVRDSWIQHVHTFRNEGNVNGSHLLSNGILLNETRGVTISHCSFQRPQYGGAGGNGYMYRLSSANENLIQYSEAAYSRHGFVFSHFSTSGNVIYRCIDRFTARQTGGTGNERTLGSGSDHHMHFSHSNLVDDSDVENSYFVAKYRRSNIHALSSAHSVFWNIRGRGTQYTFSVHSDQARYGYVIGTSGEVHEVRTDVDASSENITLPLDHVEGVGKGHLLKPQSLYLDQKRKRLGD